MPYKPPLNAEDAAKKRAEILKRPKPDYVGRNAPVACESCGRISESMNADGFTEVGDVSAKYPGQICMALCRKCYTELFPTRVWESDLEPLPPTRWQKIWRGIKAVVLFLELLLSSIGMTLVVLWGIALAAGVTVIVFYYALKLLGVK